MSNSISLLKKPNHELFLVEKLKRLEYEKNILGWGKVLFPEKFTLPFCLDLHNYFIDIRHVDRTTTLAPRNHAKTIIKCFLIPIFQAICEPETFQHYLNVQAEASKAYALNDSIRFEFENNELLIKTYGDLKGEKWTQKQFELNNGVIFSAWGSGSSMRQYLDNRHRRDQLHLCLSNAYAFLLCLSN